jgi:hypothetical protein
LRFPWDVKKFPPSGVRKKNRYYRLFPDNSVRTQAGETIRAILLREDATNYFKSSILTGTWASDDTISAIEAYASQISTEVLKKALQHPTAKVRVFAAKTLAARSLMSAEEITALKIDDPTEIWQAHYLERIRAGMTFDSGEIRKNLRPILFELVMNSLGQVDTDKVIQELFQHLSYEELLLHVDFASEDGPIAYRMLAEKHFAKFGDKLRSDLEDEFKSLEATSKQKVAFAPSLFGGSIAAALFGGAKSSKVDFIAAALCGLAMHGRGDAAGTDAGAGRGGDGLGLSPEQAGVAALSSRG